jgi:5-methylcytosine-specific restriction protein A
MVNPSWTRDELILALDLYFRDPDARGNKTHPKVFELSETLKHLPIHPSSPSGTTFRNANGVGMKLSNFLRYDPDYKGKGLQRGSRLEEEVWSEFADDRKRLQQIAKAIVQNYTSLGESSPPPEDFISEDEEAPEGRVLTRVHKARERSKKIVQRKKTKVLKETGSLTCEACGFDFNEFYGELGEGFAECHHDKPVSELKPNETTKLSDLRIVCSNCHRMIHRSKPWLTIAQLSDILSAIQKTH